MPEKIEVDLELFRDLVDVASWLNGFYTSLSNGETREYHPDWNSVEYLASEARLIEQRGRAILEAVEQERAADAVSADEEKEYVQEMTEYMHELFGKPPRR